MDQHMRVNDVKRFIYVQRSTLSQVGWEQTNRPIQQPPSRDAILDYGHFPGGEEVDTR